ncbi:MAG: Hsp20/alpha crystallin family protein [Alphaproteobacteria bacterium]|uniref:Hsp20/alpha crystallin family protein n=1 Tax=Candidatus Nitrobium versatile TaxID=2884831 RepID=A0A953J5D5_9BACT|nr:Hsp20/alpha crystallin family protein [Candidatus Nitrobium versatile]
MTLKNLVPWNFGKKEVPVRREDENPFLSLRKEMDALFDDFFRGFDRESFKGTFGSFSPKVDVVENDKDIKVTAELPGLDEKDIDVSLHKDVLTISGEKREEREDKEKDYYRMERSFGSFSRSIPLPVEVQTDKVEAQFRKGVLTITLPKTAKAIKETKKIAVT